MLLRRFLFAWHEFEIIIPKHVSCDDLDLGGSEKAPWTSPKTMTEVDIVRPGCRVLIFELIAGLLA